MSTPEAIAALLHRYASGDYFSRLINHPVPHQLRQPPELVYHATVSAVDPGFTVVMPTFNHESNVADSLEAAAAAASRPFDCILVDDGSADDTVGQARAFFESRSSPMVAKATIVRNPVPVYETACDNLGFTLAETEVIVEVQADIQIRERAFDSLMLRGCSSSPAPAAISGRCGHTFRFLEPAGPLRSLFRRGSGESVGLCGKAIETPEVIDPLKGRMFRCETVNRGPWLVFKSDLERHGYLDERYFFQGNDDHDYHRRIFEAEQRRPIYVPLSLHAPLAFGAYRRPRTGVNRDVFKMLTAEKRGSPDFNSFLRSLGPTLVPEAIA